MKKKIFLLLIAFNLLMFGSGLAVRLNAQTSRRKAVQSPNPATGSRKIVAPEKAAAVQEILRRKIAAKSGLAAADDPCNTDTPLVVGQSFNGALTSGDCHLSDGTYIDFYSFSGSAGQPIAVSMNSSVFDTYLYLLDADGNIVDQNDDTGNTSDSRIPVDGGVITLPSTGTFYIGANSYDSNTFGAYTISLNTDTRCTITAISYNQPVSDALATSDCPININDAPFYTDLYKFNGTAGQQISIAMNSTAVDSYLVLHTPSGDGSVDDDDGGGGVNARIPAGNGTFTLPETGSYIIEASSANPAELGTYTLIVTGPTAQTATRRQFDFDGDGKADVSVFRPTDTVWYLQNSTTGIQGVQFGLATDKLVPADYDGDGKTDIAVFRNGTWYILGSQVGYTAVQWGNAGDIPVPFDFDGDGKADPGVFRNGVWYVLKSTGGVQSVQWGIAGDVPVVGDYDGDGKADFAVFRNGFWYLLNSTTGFQGFQWGAAGDKAVPADYDGDGKTDLGVFRDGTWYLLRTQLGAQTFNWGTTGDIPAPADYDGDGKADFGVFRNGTWYLQRSTAGVQIVGFGLTGDKPLPAAYQP